MTATHEFVVPKSIPIIFPMLFLMPPSRMVVIYDDGPPEGRLSTNPLSNFSGSLSSFI
jgi:hypothetical protein